jgi:heme exporter protein C
VCLAGMTLLYLTLWRYEMASKHAGAQLRALKRKLGALEDGAAARRAAAPTVSVP